MTTETFTRVTCDACEQTVGSDDGGVPIDWGWLKYAVHKDDDEGWGEFPEEYDICPTCLKAVEKILLAKEPE